MRDLVRRCRSCGKKTLASLGSNCPHCGTPYGGLAFGDDRLSTSQPADRGPRTVQPFDPKTRPVVSPNLSQASGTIVSEPAPQGDDS